LRSRRGRQIILFVGQAPPLPSFSSLWEHTSKGSGEKGREKGNEGRERRVEGEGREGRSLPYK